MKNQTPQILPPNQPSPVQVAAAVAGMPELNGVSLEARVRLQAEIEAIILAERSIAKLRVHNFRLQLMEHIRLWQGSAYFLKQLQGQAIAKARIAAKKLVTQEAVAIAASIIGLEEKYLDNKDTRTEAAPVGETVN